MDNAHRSRLAVDENVFFLFCNYLNCEKLRNILESNLHMLKTIFVSISIGERHTTRESTLKFLNQMLFCFSFSLCPQAICNSVL